MTADSPELDPARHVIPATPVAGNILGAPFTPEIVELEDNKLSFRTGTDPLFPNQSITVRLLPSAKLAAGHKVTVSPPQAHISHTPIITFSTRMGTNGQPEAHICGNGKYSLTIDLDPPVGRKFSGKIYLAMIGEKPCLLAGTFTAVRLRGSSEPPGDPEVPFVYGSVSPSLNKRQGITVGYVGGTADGKTISGTIRTIAVFDDGESGRSTFGLQTATLRLEKFDPKFDFANLVPGRYLIFAYLDDGPRTWAWVDVAATSKVRCDLTIDPAKVGTLAVKSRDGFSDPRFVPTDPGAIVTDDFGNYLSVAARFLPVRQNGVATYSNLPAGKYQFRDGDIRVEVEVIAGKTVTVDLATVKK